MELGVTHVLKPTVSKAVALGAATARSCPGPGPGFQDIINAGGSDVDVGRWPILAGVACPQFSNGLSTIFKRFISKHREWFSPAVSLELYRHVFLKDCGSHDKKTPARGMARQPAPAPGAGRQGVISGHLVLVENGAFQGIWGVGPWGGLFQLRSMIISFRGGT